jgi:hypothetical protein
MRNGAPPSVSEIGQASLNSQNGERSNPSEAYPNGPFFRAFGQQPYTAEPPWQGNALELAGPCSFVDSFDQSIYPQDDAIQRPSWRMESKMGVANSLPQTQQHHLHLQTRRDPFEYLGDVEVGLIICLLDDADLETLRRVSRSWKRYSEFFNTYAAIKERFPWANEARYKAGGNGLANLQFRRHCKKTPLKIEFN